MKILILMGNVVAIVSHSLFSIKGIQITLFAGQRTMKVQRILVPTP